MAYCENCGHKLNEGELFCSECGTPVTPVATDVQDTQSTLTNMTVSPASTPTRLTHKATNKFDFQKYKKPILITLGLLGGVGLLGAGYVIITGNNPLEQVTNTENSGSSTNVVFNQKSGDSTNATSTANTEGEQTSGNVVVFNQKSSEQVSESASAESNEATSSAQAIVFNQQSADQSNSESSTGEGTVEGENAQSTESTSQTGVVLNKVESSSTAEESGTASEGTSEGTTEKPSATLKRKTIDPRVDLAAVQAAYDATLGAIGGNHSFYFQEITDAIGEHVSGEPLVVNDTPIRSASTIKVFVLGAFFDQVAKGNLSYDTKLYSDECGWWYRGCPIQYW